MQDLNSQLMYFFSWLEELEQPIDSLKRETDSEAAMQDKEQVEIWLQQHGVSPAVNMGGLCKALTSHLCGPGSNPSYS